MKIFHSYKDVSGSLKGAVLALGNFDGVHRGHQELLKKTKEEALRRKKPAAVFTFSPHPALILQKDAHFFVLYNDEQKARLFSKLGMDAVIFQNTRNSFLKISAQSFVEDILHRTLGVKSIVVGTDFRFGYQALGTVSLLKDIFEAQGGRVIAIPLQIEGEKLSSSHIRRALEEGDCASAQKMLGRPYSFLGPVVRGDQRGRKLGFPTINQTVGSHFFLQEGIYISKVVLPDGRSFAGATSWGKKPTFGADQNPTLETTILDFSDDLYGQDVEIFFLQRLRGQEVFSTIEALQEQVQIDVQNARGFLKDHPDLFHGTNS